MKTICFHHNDTDGRASGAIVRYALGAAVTLIEVDYDGEPIPWDEVQKADRIIVVDFSFPIEDMERLADGRKMIWIDHHKSAITQLSEIAKKWDGLQSKNEAACVLTWNYFFPERPVPKAVVLIGDRDIWRWAEEETGDFTEGLYHRDNESENDNLWRPLLDNNMSLLENIINDGHQCRMIRLQEIKRMVDERGFGIYFENHHTLAINTPGDGDIGQYVRDCGYDIAYCYIDKMINGTLTTFVTIFSEMTDVSEIARKFGGGGHAGASGFSFRRSNTPFPSSANVVWDQSKINPQKKEGDHE
jgi:oligoribonuclease NrnB/cAMP/cGMP phosphodiesterase (DHH superfamily)